jgi:hypothetical protein
MTKPTRKLIVIEAVKGKQVDFYNRYTEADAERLEKKLKADQWTTRRLKS